MKSKQNRTSFVLLLLAAIMGSALTLFIYPKIDGSNNRAVTIRQVDAAPGIQTFYTDPQTKELVALDFTETAERVMPAVVHITSTFENGGPGQSQGQDLPEMYDFFRRFFDAPESQRGTPRQPQQGSGSGVIISQDGYIVTNNHVVGDADKIEVSLSDNRKYEATLIGTDPTTDIALIQIKDNDLPSLAFYNSDNVKVGEWVLAVGNPFNLTSTVTAGIVSAKGRSIDILNEEYKIESFIQTDAAINRGNSGGALVNAQGQLVGINTAIASPNGYYAGYGFAVPSNLVSKVVQDLMEFGAVQRGILGVGIRNINGINGVDAKEQGLDISEGVWVDSVYENSAAREAGLQKGDVIIALDEKTIKSSPELQELIARKRPGDKVEMKVYRNGKEIDITATLKSRTNTAKRIAESGRSDAGVLDVLGVELETVSKEEAEKLDIDGGVKITELFAGKLATQTRVRKGFIITKIDDKSVRKVEDVLDMLENRRGGVMLEGVYDNAPGVHYYAFGL